MSPVAVVTGAARGMGRACAARLAPAATTLVLVDRDESGLAETASALASRTAEVVTVALDVTDRDALAGLAEAIRERGPLGPVAHAAGISPTMADWRTVVRVDLVGSALLVEALTPLVTDGTAMVCFASMASQLLVPVGDPAADPILDDPLAPDLCDRLHDVLGATIEDSGTAYGYAKRGVQRLVRRTAVRWGPRGGRICSISPGMIDTPQGRQEAASQPMMAFMLEHSPIPREGRPEEIAAVVAFLCSPDAGFMTGCDVLVDGGVCAAMEALAAE